MLMFFKCFPSKLCATFLDIFSLQPMQVFNSLMNPLGVTLTDISVNGLYTETIPLQVGGVPPICNSQEKESYQGGAPLCCWDMVCCLVLVILLSSW